MSCVIIFIFAWPYHTSSLSSPLCLLRSFIFYYISLPTLPQARFFISLRRVIVSLSSRLLFIRTLSCSVHLIKLIIHVPSNITMPINSLLFPNPFLFNISRGPFTNNLTSYARCLKFLCKVPLSVQGFICSFHSALHPSFHFVSTLITFVSSVCIPFSV